MAYPQVHVPNNGHVGEEYFVNFSLFRGRNVWANSVSITGIGVHFSEGPLSKVALYYTCVVALPGVGGVIMKLIPCRFANHEKSRRHRDNVVLLKQLLEEEERELRGTSQQTTTTDGQQMTTDKQTTTTDERQTTTTDEQQTTTTTDVQQATSINDTQETMTSSMGAEQDRLSDEGEEVGEAKAGVGVKRKEGEEDEGKAGEVKRKEGEEEEGKAGEVKRKEGEEEEGKAGEVKRKEEEEDEGKAGKVKRKVEVEDEGEVVIGVCERLESQQLSDSDTDLANAASLRYKWISVLFSYL